MARLWLNAYREHRSCVNISCSKDVVQHAEEHRPPKHQATIIHRRSCRVVRRRPQAEEKDDDKVNNSKAIRHDAPNTRNAPQAPREFLARDVREAVSRAGIEFDIAACVTPEQKHGDEQIGAEQTDDGERNDVVERGGRTEHDECENARQCRGQEDGEHGDCRSGIYALDVLPARNGSVAGKGPELARGGCDDTERGA